MWFSAKLLFRADVDDQADIPPLHEASIRILKADSEEQAKEMAAETGVKEECNYKNSNGDLVQWRFVRIEEVQAIDDSEIRSGTEVFFYMFRAGLDGMQG